MNGEKHLERRGGLDALYPLLNFAQALFLASWSVFWIPFSLLLTLLTLNRAIALVCARHFWAPPLIKFAGARFRPEPLPPIDWSRPYIFVMNHESMLDIPCAFAVVPSNLRFVAKKVLKYVPFLGWYMWATGMVFVDRSDPAAAIRSLAAAAERIRRGTSIIAFPEGTRSRTGEILPFKKGPFGLALEAGVPVVPMAISGSARVVPSDGFRLRPGEVRMKIGMPIETAGRDKSDRRGLAREVRAAVIQLHREIGGAGATDMTDPD